MNTQDTTFSIERYQELVVEKGTHEVRNIANAPVTVFTVNAESKDGCVVGEVSAVVQQWFADGRMFKGYDRAESDLKIVLVQPKIIGWTYIYQDAKGRLQVGQLYEDEQDIHINVALNITEGYLKITEDMLIRV